MPENIYLAGFMGTGKSTVGKLLAAELHRPFLDTDALIEQREGRSIGVIFEQRGEPYFRKLEAQTVEEMLPLQGCVVALGGGVLENPLLREKLAASGRLVVLHASGEEILRRLGESEKKARPLLNPEGVEELLAKRAAGYGAGTYHIATEGKSPEEIAREICVTLGEKSLTCVNERFPFTRRTMVTGKPEFMCLRQRHCGRRAQLCVAEARCRHRTCRQASVAPRMVHLRRRAGAAKQGSGSTTPEQRRRISGGFRGMCCDMSFVKPLTPPRQVLEARGEGYSYSVIIGVGVLGDPEVWQHLEASPSLVVGDTLTLPLFAQKLPFSKPLHTLSRGEEAKTSDSLLKIYGALLREGVHRGESLVALGGGTVGDAAGFAAATWMRGISYVQCPTTLLSQIDSALGGKTGINLPEGKNLVGAFHHPRLVVADVLTLQTLSREAYRQGLGEAVKYGLGEDPALFVWLWEHRNEIVQRDPEILTELVAWCCRCKLKVVAEDTREAGVRMRLNLGHTLGHALESASGYSGWQHGDAVGVGMRIVTRISRKMGYCTAEDEARLEELLRAFGMPLHPDRPWEEIAPYLKRDKKIRRGALPLVIPRHEDISMITTEVPPELVQESYEELLV
jgi:3-dehydroquinate synthase